MDPILFGAGITSSYKPPPSVCPGIHEFLLILQNIFQLWKYDYQWCSNDIIQCISTALALPSQNNYWFGNVFGQLLTSSGSPA